MLRWLEVVVYKCLITPPPPSPPHIPTHTNTSLLSLSFSWFVMGIDDRPLPKPPVVKFAAVVTTAAFAGRLFFFCVAHAPFFMILFFVSEISFKQEYFCFLLLTKAITARMSSIGCAFPLPTFPSHRYIDATHIICRFIKEWTTFSPLFGDCLLPSQESHDVRNLCPTMCSSHASPWRCFVAFTPPNKMFSEICLKRQVDHMQIFMRQTFRSLINHASGSNQ